MKWINNFYWWDIIKIIISVGKKKVQFTLTFYFKQNKAVQFDLQRFEIFIFSSLLSSLPPGKMLEQKLHYGFSRFGICVQFKGFKRTIMGYSRKNPNSGWGYTYLKTPWDFLFFYFIPGNFRQNKTQPLDIPQNCVSYIPWKFQGQKQRTLEIPNYFFLGTLGNSTSILINY